MKFLHNYKQSFNKGQLMSIEFGEVFDKSYIKIISNIYYLNLRKTQKKFKDEYVNKAHSYDYETAGKVFNDFYRSYLKETRTEVVKFFKVPESPELSAKIKLRIYPYYFPAYHPQREAYEKLSNDVNLIFKNIQLGGCIEELYDDNHPEAITKPVDKLIDFSHMLTSSSNVNDNAAENRKILTKFGEVYGKNNKSDDECD